MRHAPKIAGPCAQSSHECTICWAATVRTKRAFVLERHGTVGCDPDPLRRAIPHNILNFCARVLAT
jgi:hypothetical protein